ncbi:zinc ribbon domain-containing protein [Sulfurimonas sp. CS5]|uniref:zinc ribbon domain-containing protein n=1 Tax=Sulfurimonas sp. CS5 TaxID=3391145 RepID=UPI0039E93370
MFKCEKCGSELEPNAKFCTNCGENIDEKVFSVSEEKKDVSLWFLPLGLLIGFVFEFYTKKIELGANDTPFFQFISIILDKAPTEFYAEMFGAGLAKVLIPAVIIGFIWGVKSIMSKKYEKPILHIFIGTMIVTILTAIGAGN